MDLEGCSMVEFRRDREGRPVLMEVNPRMGGSVSLAMRAGVNFPQLAFDWQAGRALQLFAGYRTGVRLRWLGGDILNLRAAYVMQGHPDVPSRRAATTRFV